MTSPSRVVNVCIRIKMLPGLIGIHIIDLLWLIHILWAHVCSVTNCITQSIHFIARLDSTVKEGNLCRQFSQLCCHPIVYLHLVDYTPSSLCTLLLGISPQHLIQLHSFLSCFLSHSAPYYIIDHILTLGCQSIIEKLILQL